MATAMRSDWIFSILASSTACASNSTSGLLSRNSLMMEWSSLRWSALKVLPPAGFSGAAAVDSEGADGAAAGPDGVAAG